MIDLVWAIAGLILGVLATAAVFGAMRGRQLRSSQQWLEQAQKDREREMSAIIENVKATFAALSREALSVNADDFLKLAKTRFDQQSAQADQTLDNKKKLIDARLEEMGTRLKSLTDLVHTADKQRAESHGALTSQIQQATRATNHLQDTTALLREALANPQRRGQWGERMAEDVLRLAGMIEGINYQKQKTLASGNRPDFTFELPDNRRVHMDAKFPLGNYLRMLEATDDGARESYKTKFLRDVRSRIKEVTTRDYIDPAAGTVDYVLVFIPNEQVYGFIHQHDATLLDDAMRDKAVLCSPLTLYAILAVIRQAVDNFHLRQGAGQILTLLEEFKKQWEKYVQGMDKMGDRLEAAVKEYDQLVKTRTRQLDRQLDKIDDLRAAQGGSAAAQLVDAGAEERESGT